MSERSEQVRCRVGNEKRNFISTSNHTLILFCISYKNNSPLLTSRVDYIDD